MKLSLTLIIRWVQRAMDPLISDTNELKYNVKINQAIWGSSINIISSNNYSTLSRRRIVLPGRKLFKMLHHHDSSLVLVPNGTQKLHHARRLFLVIVRWERHHPKHRLHYPINTTLGNLCTVPSTSKTDSPKRWLMPKRSKCRSLRDPLMIGGNPHLKLQVNVSAHSQPSRRSVRKEGHTTSRSSRIIQHAANITSCRETRVCIR